MRKLESKRGLELFKSKQKKHSHGGSDDSHMHKQNISRLGLINATLIVEALLFAIIGVPILLFLIAFKTPQPYRAIMILGSITTLSFIAGYINPERRC